MCATVIITTRFCNFEKALCILLYIKYIANHVEAFVQGTAELEIVYGYGLSW